MAWPASASASSPRRLLALPLRLALALALPALPGVALPALRGSVEARLALRATRLTVLREEAAWCQKWPLMRRASRSCGPGHFLT